MTVAPNPTLTDGNGRFAFYAADGRYTLVVSKAQFVTQTVADILLEDPATSPSDTLKFSQSPAAAAGTVSAKLQQIISVKDAPFNALGDGVTDDTAAIVAADIAAAAAKASLFFQGTFLCSSQLVPTCKWIFDGRSTDSSTPASYLIKKSTMTVPLVLISLSGFVGEGLAVVGQGGNTGDAIQITGNNVILYHPVANAAGGVGIRVGLDAGGNANSFTLIAPKCINNGGRGIYLHDNTAGAPNANGGTIITPFLQGNASDGIGINNAAFNTIIGILSENNTGYGIYLDSKASGNRFYGGDVEVNTAGAINTVAAPGKLLNVIELGQVSGTITNNGGLTDGTWTPTVAGAAITVTTARYRKRGALAHLDFDLTWPATADGTAVVIAGMNSFPGTPLSNGGSFVAGYTTYGFPIHGVAGAAGISLYNKGGVPSTQLTNADLSTLRIIGSCTYSIAQLL